MDNSTWVKSTFWQARQKRVENLLQVNAVLLEALKGVMDMLDGEYPCHPMTEKVRAAIKLAEVKE